MKPKDLKHPFSWQDRKVLYRDRIWFIPDFYNHYDDFSFPGFSHPDFFGNDQPVRVEYCSGNGHWIIEKAKRFQGINWVAVEKQFLRARKIWSKIYNEDLKNLIVICGEGGETTRRYFPDGSIERVYVNFPDPWPKERHAKHRIIQPSFMQQAKRVLQKLGQIILVTDDASYSEQMINEGLRAGFVPALPKPYYTPLPDDYGSSFFETLFREKGKVNRYHAFVHS